MTPTELRGSLSDAIRADATAAASLAARVPYGPAGAGLDAPLARAIAALRDMPEVRDEPVLIHVVGDGQAGA